MEIDLNNYVSYALDYLEGTLDDLTRTSFEMFLEAHPEIKEELFTTSNLQLKSSGNRYRFKHLLKKLPGHLPGILPQPDNECIAFVENDLNADDQKAFQERLIHDPSVQRLVHIYKKIHLEPGVERIGKIAFLKKPIRKVPVYWWYSSAVAAVLLVLFLLQVVSNIFLTPPASNVSENNIPEPMDVSRPLPKESLMDRSAEPDVWASSAAVPAIEKDIPEAFFQSSKKSSPSQETEDRIRTYIPTIRLTRMEGSGPSPEPIHAKLHAPYIYLPEYLSEWDLNTLASYSIEDFKVKLLRDSKEGNNSPPLIFNLVQSGVKGINKIAGWDMQLQPGYDEKGRFQSFSFLSQELKISSRVQND